MRVTLLITAFTTTHEPPSRALEGLGFGRRDARTAFMVTVHKRHGDDQDVEDHGNVGD